jgi:arylsulfatase A-like enzyme
MPTATLSRRSFFRTAAGMPFMLSAAVRQRPNIVVILADDMGYSDLSCYGGEIPTPNLDRLASRGVKFAQFYNTARCSPSRASLMTGLYPHQAGMGHLDGTIYPGSHGYQGRLSDDSVTIAEVLKSAGYFTAISGKWHLGQQHGTPAAERGFDRSLTCSWGGIYFPDQRGGERLLLNGRPVEQKSPELGDSWYAADLWTKFGLKFIDEARHEKKPFFLYLAHTAPHFPLMAPPEDIARFRGKYMNGWDILRQQRYERQIKMGLIDRRWRLTERPPLVPAWDSLSRSDKDRFDGIMAVYTAVISRMDRSVGTLVESLKQRGVLDNTLILFLSDNGGNAEGGPNGRYNGNPPGSADSDVFLGMSWATLSNTPFRRYKHFTHEGGISAPLIAHWPAGIPKGREGQLERQQGHLIDIMATALDVSGAKYPSTLHGKPIIPFEGTSLAPAFSGGKLARKGPIFFMHENNLAVRSEKWKLVSRSPGPWELFDMELDRTEMRNLAAERPDLVAELAGQYDAWARRTYVEPWRQPPIPEWGAIDH